MTDALDGFPETDGDALTGRVPLRRVRLPSVAARESAEFNFGDGQRGWVARPSDQLLTSPAYADGKIFLGGGFASHHFYAYNAFSGSLDWALAAPDGGPTAAIVDEDRVFFNTESCTLFVADKDTGELVWKKWLGDPLMSQPALAGDLVISAYPKSGTHELGAFRVSDGEVAWKIEIDNDIIQAPHVAGGDIFFATMNGAAYRVRARDGHVHWQRDVGATSAMWVDRERALLTRRVDVEGAPHEEPIVLRVGNGSIASRGARTPAPYLAGTTRDRQLASGQNGAWGNVRDPEHLGLSNVASGWAFQGSSPAVSDGRAYFAIGGDIRARDIQTGDEVWSRTYQDAEGAQAVSPPAVVGSMLVFGTVDGHLYFSDIDTGMTIRAYDLGEPIAFQPVVAQGWVYVGTGNGKVIGLEIGDPMMDGWHMWGGNAQHAGLVEHAGEVDQALLASLARPSRGTMRVGAYEREEEETATDATPAPAETGEEEEEDEDELPDLPLLNTSVEANVSGFVARVTVTQSFTNDQDDPIEALYLFPLPADAAVDDMEMRIGSRRVRAQIKRRAAAQRTYTQARSEGRRAALLEQQRPNLFAQRVANIAPGERIDVVIQYVQTLPFEDGQYELVFPMNASPRFDPSNPGSVVRPANERRAADSIALTVNVDAGMPIVELASPSHQIDADRQGERARVRLTENGPDRDFVLRYAIGGELPRATMLTHRAEPRPDDVSGDPNGYFTLVVQPPTATGEALDAMVTPREITFVVDTSSSMRGRAMEHAKAVMRRAFEGLRETDTFNVLLFSDGVRALAETPLAANAENLTRARAFVNEVRAVGATQMVPAIERALSQSAPSGGRLGIVTLLTDGYIGNERDVLRSIATHLGDRRIYTLGVGGSVNRLLLERASEVGRGRAIVSTLSEDPSAAADRFAAFVERPVFTDVEIDWGGLDVQDVYPRRASDLFAGKPLVLNGRFGNAGTGTVTIRGSMKGERYERVVPVNLPAATGGDPSHGTLWARAAIHERENQLTLRDDDTLVEEITELGLAHRLVTRFTSFVAVEEVEEEEEEEEPPATRATVSPARSLPGDPEIRVPAPRDASAVTILLPFGETLSAEWDHEVSQWTARFLIPRDAEEGTYPIDILVRLASGEVDRYRVWYTVDQHAPTVTVDIEGDALPGNAITLIARQTITDHDLLQVGRRRGELTEARAQLLSDARRVEARLPNGEVINLRVAGPGTYRAELTIPEDARDTYRVELVVVDLAANIRHQAVDIAIAEQE